MKYSSGTAEVDAVQMDPLLAILTEPKYTYLQLSKLTGLNCRTLRRQFQNEAGLIIVGRESLRGSKRRYETVRIPQSVVLRVFQRLVTKGTDIQ